MQQSIKQQEADDDVAVRRMKIDYTQLLLSYVVLERANEIVRKGGCQEDVKSAEDFATARSDMSTKMTIALN